MDSQPSSSTRDIDRYRRFLNGGSPGPHAYVVLLGLDSFDGAALLRAIQKGLPWKTFERFVTNIDLPAEQVADVLGIPRRTLARRKVEGRLKSDESDRLVRLARVFAKALHLFDGDRDAARLWLTDINIALGRVSPLDYARTSLGADEVEALVDRIEYGIFS
ncbi:MAG TPA: antitoxin Xre-like helix-turn-helix domain-containing protein [Thermoanaerobaculia bacterium]|nr:antitoxin Xre-like helix-turn-helix domain-containing protein [Thermoanaerobaculia bacterium]